MKSLGFLFSYLATAQARRNFRVIAWMLALFVVMVAGYSTIFHEIMENEGQDHSWPTAVYWTVVTMTTLGYGDIAFSSDLGRTFSVVVLLSGSVFILVLLPFSFIQFVFVPWMESSQRARAPRKVPDSMHDHVVLTGTGAIESALVTRLEQAGVPYVTLIDEIDDALRLHDQGRKVMVGALDDPEAFRNAGVERAALVAATQPDTTNTNIAFTVREISESVAIVATANSEASVDILELAGCNQVLQLGEMLGAALARRVLVPDGRSHVIGRIEELLIAEATPREEVLGVPLRDTGLRQQTGLTVAGVWERGELTVARPETVLTATSTLLLAGSEEQLGRYDDLFGTEPPELAPVIIIGGGRVGRAAGRQLAGRGFDYRIVEQRLDRIRDPQRYVVGNAADLKVLQSAGIEETSTVVITTHDDDVNVYLTIYCRRLRPDLQIIARARLDRNVTTLHRAGADAVLSYASTGANAIWNVLSEDNTVQLAEGLDVFRVTVPPQLIGKTLRKSGIRESTGCTVVAVELDDRFVANPDVNTPIPAGTELVLIGDRDSELRFLGRYRTELPH